MALEQMMRRFLQRFAVRFRRQQIEPAINLECICADNFRLAFLRNFRGQLRFPCRGRSNDIEDAFHQVGTSLRDVRLIVRGGPQRPQLRTPRRGVPTWKAERKKPEDIFCLPVSKPNELEIALISGVMLARFRSTYDQFAAEEFLVVQFRDGAFGFVHSQHLHEGKTFRALIMFVGDDFRVLHLADAIEQLEEIALGGVEGEIADVETRRRDFD